MEPLCELLTNSDFDIQVSCLPQLANLVNILNKYFKHKVIGEQYEIEKFSMKVCHLNFDVEYRAEKLLLLTKAIAGLEEAIFQNPAKNSKVLREYYYQISIMFDGLDLGSPSLNHQRFEQGWTENSSEQLIQYFMFNKISFGVLPNLLSQIKSGPKFVQEEAFFLFARIISMMASSVKRNQLLNDFKSIYFFENTKSSFKQILYIKLMNTVITNSSIKSFKSNHLADFMKHANLNELKENLQQKAMEYFIVNSVPLINDNLTYQDEDLALKLLNFMDSVKFGDVESLSEKAMKVDKSIKYNIG